MSAVTEDTVRSTRSRTRFFAIMSTVLTSQLFFWSFALGAFLGPAPLRSWELGLGGLSSIMIGIFLAWPLIRRRVEQSAQWVTHLREGKKSRRLAIFDEYLTIDREIVLKKKLESVVLEHERLQIRYDKYGQREPEERAFEGPLGSLERAERLLSAA